EKLRVRSYGAASESSQVFIEIKKKYKGVVYKRRVGMDISAARAYLGGGEAVDNKTQIMREISYFMQRYAQLMPSVYISYEREAFLGKSDSGFRITFDRNILWRTQDISLSGDVYGDSLLGGAYVLLEVKTALGLPTWLTRFLSANGIFKMSFSKYGSAYKIMTGEGLGGTEIA
ncbi:MAG: polyphosphate polymerase domain-containing protein, partial [Christensenella sp.]